MGQNQSNDAGAGAGSSSAPTAEALLTERLAEHDKVPIVYHERYNIGFWGLENLHPFDSKKYMKVYNALIEKGVLKAAHVYTAPQASDAQLRTVHTSQYLDSLNSASTVAAITEVPPVGMLPASTARAQVLVPMLFGTGGSILAALLSVEGPHPALPMGSATIEAAAVGAAAAAAGVTAPASASSSSAPTAAAAAAPTPASDAKVAVDGDQKGPTSAPSVPSAPASKYPKNGYGWAINLAGGYHHACGTSGGGFCVYADITLAIVTVRERHPDLTRFMIVDLDAHQGNGHERDKRNGVFDRVGASVYIMDMYNAQIYPRDTYAKKAIDAPVELMSGTSDKEYLTKLDDTLGRSIRVAKPQLIVYNAGTDCLSGDPLGRLDISAAGIVRRDELVFEHARKAGVPVVMLLSGGYQKSNAAVIADSIQNLDRKFGLIETALKHSSAAAVAAAAAAASAANAAGAGAAAPMPTAIVFDQKTNAGPSVGTSAAVAPPAASSAVSASSSPAAAAPAPAPASSSEASAAAPARAQL